MARQQQWRKDLQWALTDVKSRLKAYQLAEEYYSGKHKIVYATEAFRTEFGEMFKNFSENLCQGVVDAVRDRLKLTGFTPAATDTASSDRLDELWRLNRMDLRANEVHVDALTSGDAYVIVWVDDDGNPVLYPNPAANCTVRYDKERPGRINMAVKVWVIADGRTRANIYYEDRVEKYATKSKSQLNWLIKGGAWSAGVYEPFEEEEGGSIVYYETVGLPAGTVPMFHFGNSARIGRFGVPEHKQAIPLQDALNKDLLDLLVTGEYHSLPQRWATGIESPRDPRTQEKINQFQPGDFWATKEKDAKFGSLEAADLEQFVKVADRWVLAIARVTGTPLHYFYHGGGTPPSGEALKTAEARLTGKVYDRQVAYGAVWEDIFKLMLAIADEPVEGLDAAWEDTTPRDDTAVLNNVTTKVEKLGMGLVQAYRELGYSEKEAKRILKEAVAEQTDADIPKPAPAALPAGQRPPAGQPPVVEPPDNSLPA
jgi:hypothetical protein